ncbi:F0F1 ATP synthase subunit B [Limnochorda pilosa]|uniref:ATP synthase subunit b n=1 Tax=Limnochorda pilosa TaxID=1555112 RepID=A0A0K2SQ05_LIMPI|nr:F0F1 ATP synthase subunit B [Limnochorda pilosa]BAS28919.1 F0F1 ATP synthase subunit B [Limnochorda pilosa]
MFDPTFVVHAAEEGAVNPLSFEPWTFVFQLINVLVVLLALYYMLFRPLGNMIRSREEKVARTLDEASQARERASELEATYDQKLREAQREIQRMMEAAQQAAERRRQELVARAQDEADRTLQRAKEEIAREREEALAAIRQEVAGLALAAASQVVGRSLDGEDQRRLVEEFVENVGPVKRS